MIKKTGKKKEFLHSSIKKEPHYCRMRHGSIISFVYAPLLDFVRFSISSMPHAKYFHERIFVLSI